MPIIKKDLSSTEKLLDVIRGKNAGTFGELNRPMTAATAGRQSKKKDFGWPDIYFRRKRYTVGIDIGREFICLVKTARNADNSHSLIDKKIIKYNPESSDTPELNSILRSSIVEFCSTVADCDIWTKISTRDVNVYFITIPRVPRKQQGKVIFWTAKKEGFIDEERQIFDFEIQGEIVEQGAPKYAVMFYTVHREEINRIKSLAEGLGLHLAGITIVPFAMQNIFRSRWIPATEEIFASLFIGDNYSRIDVYHRENLVMTRGIKTGSTSSMAEAIVSRLRERTGSVKLNHQEAKKILCSMGSATAGSQENESLRGFRKEEIIEMIAPVWERLARQIDLTLKTSSIGNKKVEKIYILSSVNFDKSILDYMSDQLDTKTEFFDPFKNRRTIASEQSLSFSDRILISPALGFALSDNSRTPNAIFTHEEKNQESKAKRMNRFVFMSFLAALMVCVLTLFYQGAKLTSLKQHKTLLEKELTLQGPLLSEASMRQAVDNVKMQQKLAHQYSQKYLGLAVIGEIADLTPQAIRLISLQFRELNPSSPSGADKAAQPNVNDLVMEGIIFAQKDVLESELTQYVMKLENSPVFSRVSVQQKNIVPYNKKDVMHFVLNAKLG